MIIIDGYSSCCFIIHKYSTGAGTERIGDMDLPGMATYLDWINVMTYDFHGKIDSISFI